MKLIRLSVNTFSKIKRRIAEEVVVEHTEPCDLIGVSGDVRITDLKLDLALTQIDEVIRKKI